MNCKKEFFITAFLLFGLTLSCQKPTKEVKDTTKVTTPEKKYDDEKIIENMVLIPAGEFIMGSDEVDKEMIQQRFGMRKIPYQNEHPERKENLEDYYIDKYEVTNKKYKEFVNDTRYTTPIFWLEGIYPADLAEMPVTMVSWHSADSYCRWRGKRLPTEAEWEKAARGPEGRTFAWGNEFDQKKANVLGLYGGTTPVGKFKDDVSYYGLHDITGNVSEWMIDWYKPYPGNEFLDNSYGETFKVLRGGSWGGIGHYSFELFYRAQFRNNEKPEATLNDVGFRCAYTRK